jgi:tRNA wybutosine-synthesizing protein 3
MQARFDAKKARILSTLAVPDENYTDASPKGSVDEGIRELVHQINGNPGFVTTSSCSGRIAVYLEGRSTQSASTDADISRENATTPALSSSGKGGGKWLFTSHDQVDLVGLDQQSSTYSLLGFDPGSDIRYPKGIGDERFVHFKFEPMVS